MQVSEFLACWLSDSGTLSPRHAVLWAGYLSLLAVLICLLGAYINRAYRRRWYGPPSGVGKALSWDEVRYLMTRDPLSFQEQDCALSRLWKWCRVRKKRYRVWRKRYWAWKLYRLRKRFRWPWRIIRDLILAVPIAFGLWSVWVWLRRYGAEVDVEDLARIATVVGGGSILVAAFGVFHQGRVKSRAENRQNWINELRDEINAVIADIPDSSYHQHAMWLSAKERALETRHAKIELYLNPSERVHRAFMAMIRYMYGVEDLEIDKEVFKELRRGRGKPPDLSDKNDWQNAKSDVIRLANVLLKREWEQVKLIA